MSNGIIFIDEAYALVQDNKGTFGNEILATIVNEMTKEGSTVTFIFAGYEKAIKQNLLSANEGLVRRFANVFLLKNLEHVRCALKTLLVSKSTKILPRLVHSHAQLGQFCLHYATILAKLCSLIHVHLPVTLSFHKRINNVLPSIRPHYLRFMPEILQTRN